MVIRERFTPELLGELPTGRALVVCDVDGYETELFTPTSRPYWERADLIIELHDCFGHPCREPVTRCLAASHAIELLPSRSKHPPPLPSLDRLSDADRRLAVNEIRPAQEWVIARSLGRAG